MISYKVRAKGLGLLALGLCATFASAQIGQCADSFEENFYQCVYKTCHNTVTVYTPYSGDAEEYICDSVKCCGQLFTTCRFDGTQCYSAGFKRLRAEMRQGLSELAQAQELLVADCKGHYIVYAPVQQKDQPDLSDLMQDRILR